jgi:hypothetical protein
MLAERRRVASELLFVLANEDGNVPHVSSLDHMQGRNARKLFHEFVLHSTAAHTYLTRLASLALRPSPS